jgi:hypothetical protein
MIYWGALNAMKTLIYICGFYLCTLSEAFADPLVWANGTWGADPESVGQDVEFDEGVTEEEVEAYKRESVCGGKNVLKVSVDKEGLNYVSYLGEQRDTSRITDIRPRSFAVKYDGETRMMRNGEPHVWHMLFLDRDSFVWVLDEWLPPTGDGGMTIPYIRCRDDLS